MASKQTTNYGLNQWAAEDRVMRTEFNADNAKIDAALGTIPVVKLGEWTIPEGDGTFVLDLTELDRSGFSGLRLRFQTQNTSKNIYLTLNNCASYIQLAASDGLNSNKRNMIFLLKGNGLGHADLYTCGSGSAAFIRAVQINSSSISMTDSEVINTEVTVEGLTTLTLTCYEGTFGANCTLSLYGLRY